jgi:hypothetical protein
VATNGMRADDDGNFTLPSNDKADSLCSLSDEEWSNGVDAPLS